MSKVVAEAVSRARAAIGEAAAALPPGSVLVDSDDLRQGEHKLGLGSSAATAVAPWARSSRRPGISIAKNRERLLAVALAAHRAAQRQLGSGADVVAAVHGGLVKVARLRVGAPTVRAAGRRRRALRWSSSGPGGRSRPRALIEAVQRFARSAPAAYREIMTSLQEIADRFVAELAGRQCHRRGRGGGTLRQTAWALGGAASVPIVTAGLASVRESWPRSSAAWPSRRAPAAATSASPCSPRPRPPRLFARALTKPLAPLGLDLDWGGVRRRVAGEPEAEISGLFHV